MDYGASSPYEVREAVQSALKPYFESLERGKMSRRDRFAAAALTGLLSVHADAKWSDSATAVFAVKAADALLAELDKPQT